MNEIIKDTEKKLTITDHPQIKKLVVSMSCFLGVFLLGMILLIVGLNSKTTLNYEISQGGVNQTVKFKGSLMQFSQWSGTVTLDVNGLEVKGPLSSVPKVEGTPSDALSWAWFKSASGGGTVQQITGDITITPSGDLKAKSVLSWFGTVFLIGGAIGAIYYIPPIYRAHKNNKTLKAKSSNQTKQ